VETGRDLVRTGVLTPLRCCVIYCRITRSRFSLFFSSLLFLWPFLPPENDDNNCRPSGKYSFPSKLSLLMSSIHRRIPNPTLP